MDGINKVENNQAVQTDFKSIHIGNLILERVKECNIEIDRICNFFKCFEGDVIKMYQEEDIRTDLLLKWSKLLGYDFFRMYTQHLVLYAPPDGEDKKIRSKPTALPVFRKNIYTKELISFVMEQLNTGAMKKDQVIEEYRIPKTTLYKWLSKYNHNGH
ncbi:transposase [Chryseobacterium aurantiacum]|uniref:transposase n=1 Tax=Chryseobacterium aurantiacum TaxID=2116499 RepID=UPI000D1334E2|nr:transposase [Chryseobacterium aurantiacum]